MILKLNHLYRVERFSDVLVGRYVVLMQCFGTTMVSYTGVPQRSGMTVDGYKFRLLSCHQYYECVERAYISDPVLITRSIVKKTVQTYDPKERSYIQVLTCDPCRLWEVCVDRIYAQVLI